MAKSKRWIIGKADNKRVAEISNKFNINPLVAKLIYLRGIQSDEQIKSYISKDISCFHDPYLLPDMQNAVDFVRAALKGGKKIAVFGDYDVDGITSTYIVYDYLNSLGANVIYYIPDRAEEGYGISVSAIDYLHSQNVNLIITVDVGITAVNEISYAKSNGIDVIVTDHHTVKEEIPDCIAVINPKRKDNKYPFDALAGVGVAFKLIYALSGCDMHILDKYCPIAAIGTIADMVPLTDENRFISDKGLAGLKTTGNNGINALISTAGLADKDITASTVGFVIAPRLNAAGRIASAQTSVKLLLENDYTKALKIALELEDGNKQRQTEEQRIFSEALEIIYSKGLHKKDVIVVAKENWHHGVIGIVSSRITEMFYKPSTVISINDDGTGKASGRSIKNFNLFYALDHCKEYLQKFGGHELAAGFTIYTDKIDDFDAKINQYAQKMIDDDIATPALDIDDVITIGDINLPTIDSLSILEPCGIGNKTPMFCINNINVKNLRFVNEKHAFITLEKKGNKIEMPAFNKIDIASKLVPGDSISVAGTLSTNTYKGVTYPQFLIKDIRVENKFTLNKCILSDVFTYIKSHIESGNNYISTNSISLNKNLMNYNIKTIELALQVFSELNIITYKFDTKNRYVHVQIGKNFYSKNSLTDSPTYCKYNQQ